MKDFKAVAYLILVFLVCSCHPKKVAVSYTDDLYYTETKSRPSAKPNHKSSDSKTNNTRKKLTGDTRILIEEAYSWVGTPYIYGGHARTGTDCSGYVMEVFQRALNYPMPRSTSEQSEACEEVEFNELRPGDLVFFHDLSHGKISHVGIYVGDGKFLHASSSRGVMESMLSEKYFSDRFRHAARPKNLNLK